MAPKRPGAVPLIESDNTPSPQKDADAAPAGAGGGARLGGSPPEQPPQDEPPESLPRAKELTIGKPIPHKRIQSSDNSPQASPFAHLPRHQRKAAEQYE